MLLFINACVREGSRTRRLADKVLAKTCDEIQEVKLAEIDFPVVDEAFLQKRDALISEASWDDPLFDHARQFASSDEIVVAAPYYDLSFPATVKQYFEQINVLGITFEYSPEGLPVPLCKAKKLTYVMTAGGALLPEEFGFGYVKALAQEFYGIRDVELVKAVGLDICGADVDAIMKEAEDSIG